MFLFLLFFILSFNVYNIYASNWAQASGSFAQNTVIPYYPGPNRPHWSARYGHAALSAPAADLSSFAYMYVLGGDSHHSNQTSKHYLSGYTDLHKWEYGFKNDIWRTTGTEWFVKGDMRLKSKYGRKIPRVESKLKWEMINSGLHPPLGQTYDEWIKCESFFNNNCVEKPSVMWSPRRHHAAIFFKGYIYLMGGRAREFAVLPHDRSIGGIIKPRIGDVGLHNPNDKNTYQDQDNESPAFLFSNQRELIVLKSDVWRSLDGVNWELVTPGCHINQKSYVQHGDDKLKRYGNYEKMCINDSDCYGSEICDQSINTCVCGMWSPREQFSLAQYNNFLYVSGGFASTTQTLCGSFPCGDHAGTSASGFRTALNDVWRSPDGLNWNLLTEVAWGSSFLDPISNLYVGGPRGSHAMVVSPINSDETKMYLWVIGGRTVDNTHSGKPIGFRNDIWVSPLMDNNPAEWELLTTSDSRGQNLITMPWEPRGAFSAVSEAPSSQNGNSRTIYLYGGETFGLKYLSNMWSLRLDVDNDFWREDFTSDAYYSTGSGNSLKYSTNSPSVHYVHPNSDISYLKRFWVPSNPPKTGSPYELRQYLSNETIAIIKSLGINTIYELANIDLYTLLKLRGYDFPQVPLKDRLKIYNICDYRALAVNIVSKCTLNLPSLYNGEKNMPWNNEPKFGGPLPNGDNVAWHGVDNYDFLKALSPTSQDGWDGCTFIKTEKNVGIDVNGLGMVSIVPSIRDPTLESDNLFCRQFPGPRKFHTLTSFDNRIYLIGGMSSESTIHDDTWYRDSKLPQTSIVRSPRSRTDDKMFILSSDKPGSYFEYRIWDPYNFKQVRPWNKVVKKAGMGWMNWRKGGPGSARYRIFIRAVDPAGNSDAFFSSGRNVYTWYYVSPTPWDIIFGVIVAILVLFFFAYLEYRRRVKKAAMERYAMKRMRRKFKAMQRDVDGKAVDWRTLYMEAKQEEEAGVRERKRMRERKLKEKNIEKREKEKQKREKEKEIIKKKLKANKLYKEKPTVVDADTKNYKKTSVFSASKITPGSEFDDIGDPKLEQKNKLKSSPSPQKGNNSKVITSDHLLQEETELFVKESEQIKQRKGKSKLF